MTDAEYAAWLIDAARADSRVLLVELDYAADFVSVGHGRRNSLDTLNEVTRLDLYTYSPTVGEVTFVQPTAQEGYSWEVWINGSVVATTQSGNRSFTANTSDTVNVAVASVKANGAYSKPWVASIPMGRTGTYHVSGKLGDWKNVGPGPGIGGVGTVRLGSQPWIDAATNLPYHDWLVSEPEIEDSLENFRGVGDFDAINPDPDQEVSWLDYRWRGYACRWYFGDTGWPKSAFRRVASAMLDNCRQVGAATYRFDLRDSGQSLRRAFVAADVVLNGQASSVIADVMTRAGLPAVTYIGVSTAARAYAVRLDLTPSTRVDEALVKVARSIGAYVRVSQTGQVEVFAVDRGAVPAVTLTEDDITYDGVRMVDVTPAYRRVAVKMVDGQVRSTTTQALTGDLYETLEIDTALSNVAEADTRLAVESTYASVGHAVWEIEVSNVVGVLQVGNLVGVVHRDLTGKGVVSRIKRSPLARFSRLEVTI